MGRAEAKGAGAAGRPGPRAAGWRRAGGVCPRGCEGRWRRRPRPLSGRGWRLLIVPVPSRVLAGVASPACGGPRGRSSGFPSFAANPSNPWRRRLPAGPLAPLRGAGRGVRGPGSELEVGSGVLPWGRGGALCANSPMPVLRSGLPRRRSWAAGCPAGGGETAPVAPGGRIPGAPPAARPPGRICCCFANRDVAEEAWGRGLGVLLLPAAPGAPGWLAGVAGCRRVPSARRSDRFPPSGVAFPAPGGAVGKSWSPTTWRLIPVICRLRP